MEIEVIYVLFLVGVQGSDAYSYVCLTFSHEKTLFSVAYNFAKIQTYELPQATLLLLLFFFISSFDKTKRLPVSSM